MNHIEQTFAEEEGVVRGRRELALEIKLMIRETMLPIPFEQQMPLENVLVSTRLLLSILVHCQRILDE